ncbi:MAG: hypothetical protein WCD89_14045, partial [Anaerocolumna sp.]
MIEGWQDIFRYGGKSNLLDNNIIKLLQLLNTHGYTFLDINAIVEYQIKNSDTFLIKQIVDCLHNLEEINL